VLKNEIDASWCNQYACWVNDVEDSTEGTYECNLNCQRCDKFYKAESFKEKNNNRILMNLLHNIIRFNRNVSKGIKVSGRCLLNKEGVKKLLYKKLH
jgi:hypothetical protein